MTAHLEVTLDGGLTVALHPVKLVAGRSGPRGTQGPPGDGGTDLSDDNPQGPGTPVPGTSDKASRADHVHALPTPGQIGALTEAGGDARYLKSGSGYNTPNGWAKLDGSATLPDNVGPSVWARDTEVAAAVASTLATAEAYTDAQIGAMLSTAFDWKASVKCASTGNLTLSGTSNVDGVTVPAGTRVLVKNQTDASQNGIWVTASAAWSRAADADSDAEVTGGMAVPVVSGSTNGGKAFMLVTADPIVVGSTALTFQKLDAGTLVAANNLSDLTSISTALTNLGISAFVQTLLDDASASAFKSTLGIGTSDVSGLDEQVRDVIGAALVAGSGVTVTVNDVGDTITLAATATVDEGNAILLAQVFGG